MSRSSLRRRCPTAVFERRTTQPDLHPSTIRAARKTGHLNLADKGMVAVPEQVWNINKMSLDESKHLSQSWDSCSTEDDKWWNQLDLTKLNLSSNKITEISKSVALLNTLLILDLHDNMITSLPEEIGELLHLVNLNLNRNRLTDLPQRLFLLRDLKILKLGHNDLATLHDDIGNLSLLEELDLSHNQLVRVPATLGFLSHVSKLDLSNNRVRELPPDIGSMTGLHFLCLAHNEMKSMPTSLGDITRLTYLDLRHNKLEALVPLHRCQELKELFLGNNNLKDLSAEFVESLCNLKVFDLRDNKLSSLPEEFAQVNSLERVDLTNNDLNNLPVEMGAMSHLKSLSLDGNPLRSIRRDVLQRGTVHLLKFLQGRMEESSDGPRSAGTKRRSFIEHLEDMDVYTLRKTRCLDCSGRDVTFIPDGVFAKAAEAKVNIVNLGKNQLTEIPASIEIALPLLTELIVTSNKLTSIPPCIRHARCLQYLDASRNMLSDLPDELLALTDLREVWLTANRFKKLPPVLYNLEKLEIILASDNGIETIDVAGLSKLKMLASLNLQNNNISVVPPELGNLRQLRSLQLEGNPFRQPRPAVLSKGTMLLLEYLRDRITQ